MYKIAIMGKANTGKNTLAGLLIDEIAKGSLSYKCMAFADPIKEIVMTMFPRANRDCLYGPSQLRALDIPGAFKDDKPLTYRQALIDIGTEVGRKYSDRIWLENFDHRFESLFIRNENGVFAPNLVIVTDCRFRNEFDHLKEKGFFQIRLYRETNAPEIQHISETGQSAIRDDEFDYVLFNTKSLDELKEEVTSKIIPMIK